jgi:hypothetical protein
MGKAAAAANAIYEGWNRKSVKAMAEALREDATYEGPLAHWRGAKEFLAESEKLMPGVERIRVLRQVEAGDDVCSHIQIHVQTPAGPVVLDVLEWTRTKDGLVVASRAFYDPRPLLAAMGR